MSIKIIPEPDVHATVGDLTRYREEYNRFLSYHAGPRPTFEEFVRRRQALDDDNDPPSTQAAKDWGII